MNTSVLKTIGVILLQVAVIYLTPLLPEDHTQGIFTITFATFGTFFISLGVGYLSNYKPRKYFYPVIVVLVLLPALVWHFVYTPKQLLLIAVCSLATYAGTWFKVNDFITHARRLRDDN